MVKFKETTCINVIKKTIIRESISSKEGASEDGDDDQRRNSEPAYPHEKKNKKKTSFEYDNNKNNDEDEANTTNNENSSKTTKEPRNFDKYRPKKYSHFSLNLIKLSFYKKLNNTQEIN